MPLISDLPADTIPRWGKMNAQQMVEHVAAFFRISSGALVLPLLTPEEHLPKYKEFIFSDKQFRENTKAPAAIVPDEPLPAVFATMQELRADLQEQIDAFFRHFSDDDTITTVHPVFGPLNLDEWIRLHYKHVTHHWRQFGR